MTVRLQLFHSTFSFHALVSKTYTGTAPSIYALAELTSVVETFSRPFAELCQVRNAITPQR